MGLYPHTIGVDLGQQRDHSVIAVIEEAYYLDERQAWHQCQPGPGWYWPSQLASSIQIDQARSWNFYEGRPANPPIALLHLERFELKTPYPEVVARIGALIRTPPLRLACTPLVVDATGVGAPVVEMMQQDGLGPTAVTITSGFTPHFDRAEGTFRVPKRDLISTMSVLLEQRRLRIPKSLPIADALMKELQGFKRTVTKVGNDTYAAEREQHDDMVLALALACWYREWANTHLERQNARSDAIRTAQLEREEALMWPPGHPNRRQRMPA